MGQGSSPVWHWQEPEVSQHSSLLILLTLMFFCSMQLPPESMWTCPPDKPARPPVPYPPISIQPTPFTWSISHLEPRYFAQHHFQWQNLCFPFSRCYLLCAKWSFRYLWHAQTVYTINSKLATRPTMSRLHFYWKGSGFGWNARVACCPSSLIPVLHLLWHPLSFCSCSVVCHGWWCPM